MSCTFQCLNLRYSLTLLFRCSNVNKVRIIALYIQYRDGVPDEDRRRLYQHARLSLAEQDAVNALLHLGVKIGRVSALSPSVGLLSLKENHVFRDQMIKTRRRNLNRNLVVKRNMIYPDTNPPSVLCSKIKSTTNLRPHYSPMSKNRLVPLLLLPPTSAINRHSNNNLHLLEVKNLHGIERQNQQLKQRTDKDCWCSSPVV